MLKKRQPWVTTDIVQKPTTELAESIIDDDDLKCPENSILIPIAGTKLFCEFKVFDEITIFCKDDQPMEIEVYPSFSIKKGTRYSNYRLKEDLFDNSDTQQPFESGIFGSMPTLLPPAPPIDMEFDLRVDDANVSLSYTGTIKHVTMDSSVGSTLPSHNFTGFDDNLRQNKIQANQQSVSYSVENVFNIDVPYEYFNMPKNVLLIPGKSMHVVELTSSFTIKSGNNELTVTNIKGNYSFHEKACVTSNLSYSSFDELNDPVSETRDSMTVEPHLQTVMTASQVAETSQFKSHFELIHSYRSILNSTYSRPTIKTNLRGHSLPDELLNVSE